MSVANAIVQLAAELPDPGQPIFMATCASFGAFVGLMAGVLTRRSWERTAQMIAEGSGVGYGIGLLGWLTALAMDLL